ncbi:BTAD domain-containing putative transcriptional regulator [Actinoplanes sp. NEAU-A12]|uniref:BTAD domain-containing putative transcriptional regulator n=1 Tax=Actinoplanes sandaracinus TaxID=3045177 RepID=A0ABT6X1A2_9ACTN|nr:BTAD domain-containing putative transcriptional regulator [Actinoplanes sandaracinus]MDI6105773.1 BTAD domain-containing putative transcriptional regulator [Actinoplanes sandaracinus]
MSNTEPAVRLRSYGGLRMWRAGVEVDIAAPRLRTLLAVLLAARGGVVGVAELVDLIWGAEPSPSAVNQLHRLVGQVRRLFEPDLPSRAPGRWVQPAGQGYRLVADARACDLVAVRELTEAARAAVAAGQVREAAQAWAQALERVQEPVFAGLDAEVLDDPAFVALRHERVQIAVEAADLALAEPAVMRGVPQMQRIAASARLHEPLQARMVRLLTAAGRRAEALVLFDEVRRLLADELGADPGPELRAAHLIALAGDEPGGADPAGPPRPVQLPRRVAGFVARGDLSEILEARSGGTILVLSGMGGIGKTSLAVDWAHRLAPGFPDGQLYLNLRGFDPSGRVVSPLEALNTLLESVGVSPAALGGAGIDARAARFRSAVADRRMIVLLDNARDSDQVRPLLPGAPGCLVVVTSRNRMTGLVAHEGARPVPVGRLGDAAARELLAKRIGAPRLSAEPEATTALVRFCAGLPLALSIAAAHAAVRPEMRLADIVGELTSQARLDALTTGEAHDDVRSALSWSYTALSPAAARLFRLLAVHTGPEIPFEAAASIAGLGAAVRGALAELCAANMLTEVGVQRFALHDLLRAYAGELLDSSGASERGDAQRRLIEHYVRAARAAHLAFGRPPVVPLGPPSPEVTPPILPDIASALRWYVRERPVLVCVIDLVLALGRVREAVLMVLDLRTVRSSRVEAAVESREQTLRVLALAGDLGEPVLEAAILREASIVQRPADRAAAEAHLRQALAITERSGDLTGRAHVLRNLGITVAEADRHRGIAYLRQAAEVAREIGEPTVLGFCFDALVLQLEEDGQLPEAIAVAREAFDLAVTAGNSDLHCMFAARLAELSLMTGDPSRAAEMAEWAVARMAPGEIHTQLPAYVFLAEACAALGDRDRALAACEAIHDLLRRHGIAYRETFGEAKIADYAARIGRISRTLVSASPVH